MGRACWQGAWIGLMAWGGFVLAQPEAPVPPALDAYGGCLGIGLRATGFFRTEQLGERWWLVTPAGHPFFSVGVNAMRMAGTATRDGQHHYGDACQAKYGTREAWATAQIERCHDWGVNTVGCWSDWDLFRHQLPYTVLLGVDGQDWLKGTWRDVFAEDFRAFVRDRMRQLAAPLRDDPFLLGYWLGNEMKWGPDHRGGHLFDQFLGFGPDTAAKQALVAFLRERYGTLDRLRDDFTVAAADWDGVAVGQSLPPCAAGAADTKLAWAAVVAERFFTVVEEELRTVDPNHLNLGVRFIGQLTPPAVLRVAARHVDVMSVNLYEIGPWAAVLRGFSPGHLAVDGLLAEHYRVCGKPILVSEWGYRAADAGLPNTWPPIYPNLPDQKTRAARCLAFAQEAIDRPWVVGQHWFEWTDQPPEGRFDGENNNFGLVNERDEPYPEVVAALRSLRPAVYHPLLFRR